MKYFILAVSAVLLLYACSKTPKAVTTNENILRAGKWKVSSGTVTYKLPNGADTTFTALANTPVCNQDDYLQFDSLYTGAVYGGSDKCSPADVDSIRFTWQLLNNDNTINFLNAENMIYLVHDYFNPYYIDTLSTNPTVLDTLSTNPTVLDTIYPLIFAPASVYDTSVLSATVISINDNSFTIQYAIPSIYADTTTYHRYHPINKADTVTYNITYTKM